MGQMIKKVMESWDIMLHGIEVIDRVSFLKSFLKGVMTYLIRLPLGSFLHLLISFDGIISQLCFKNRKLYCSGYCELPLL